MALAAHSSGDRAGDTVLQGPGDPRGARQAFRSGGYVGGMGAEGGGCRAGAAAVGPEHAEALPEARWAGPGVG